MGSCLTFEGALVIYGVLSNFKLRYTQFPIINSTHHLLPSPHGELAPAIHAVLDIFGTPVNVIVAHNGQG